MDPPGLCGKLRVRHACPHRLDILTEAHGTLFGEAFGKTSILVTLILRHARRPCGGVFFEGPLCCSSLKGKPKGRPPFWGYRLHSFPLSNMPKQLPPLFVLPPFAALSGHVLQGATGQAGDDHLVGKIDRRQDASLGRGNRRAYPKKGAALRSPSESSAFRGMNGNPH